MRIALEHITEPLFGWIPDINRVPKRRVAVIAGVASVIVHALLLLVFILGALVFPAREDRPVLDSKPSLELVVVPQPAAVEPPAPKLRLPERRFIVNDGLKAGEKPKRAEFESDRDMTEGSELPATGDSELPSQLGEEAPVMRDFADQDIRMKAENFALQQERSPSTQPQAAEETPQAATVAPMYAPQPVAKASLAEAEKARPEERLPEPAKPTRATPPPLSTQPKEETIAFAAATPAPVPQPAPPVPNQRETEQVRPAPNTYAKLATPKPLGGPTIAESYRREMRKTQNEGRITNRGISGLNAVNTPAGRWRKQMYDAVRDNWSMFLKQNPEMMKIGTVRVKFAINKRGGYPTEVQLDEGSGFNTAAQAALRAIKETPFAPPPADLLEGLPEEKLEDFMTFTIY